MKKLGFLFAVVVMSLMFAVSASALEPTGQCGDNVYWEYDETTGELVIYGEGEMWDYMVSSPFMHAEDIKSVSIEYGITKIGSQVFWFCSDLINITIPDSVVTIGEAAFYSCSNLNNVILSKNIEVIKKETFKNCVNLEYIELPKNLKAIEDSAFYGTSLKNILLPNSLSSIGRTVFCYTAIEKLIIPPNITTFDVSNVYDCEWLSELTILNPDCELKSESLNLRIPNQTILSSTVGSLTEKYANENNYHFLPLDGENAGIIQNHKYTVDWKTVLPATCTERGLMVKVCNVCSDVESQVITPLGHTDTNFDYKCDYGCGYEFEKPVDPIPDTPSKDCSCMCHKTGLMSLLWKIMKFFYKMFGVNKECICGVAHY